MLPSPTVLDAASCDGCGGDSYSGRLSQQWLVTQHHNKMRGALPTELTVLAYREVDHEAVVCDGNEVSLALIADLRVRIPQLQAEAFGLMLEWQILMQLLMSITRYLEFWLVLRKRRSASIYLLLSCAMPLSPLL